MVTVKDLYFRHPRGANDILRGVNLSVTDGLVTTIVGPNGSGKTTLFKCMAGLWQPRQGAILFGDQDLSHLSSSRRARIMAVVPQDHEPPFPYSVTDVVLMGRVSHVSLFSTPSREDRLAAGKAMERLGISHLSDRAYTKLSGGERQLVLIARALSQEAPILILDEPTSHLDFRNQILILRQIREIVRQKNLTVLMTLHDPNLAMQFSDRVALIHDGRILAEDLPQTVLTKDHLLKIFGINVSVIHYNGTRIIHPEVAAS